MPTSKNTIEKMLRKYEKMIENGTVLSKDHSTLTFVKKQWYQSSPTGKRLYVDGRKMNLDAVSSREEVERPKKLTAQERLAQYLDDAAERGAVISDN